MIVMFSAKVETQQNSNAVSGAADFAIQLQQAGTHSSPGLSDHGQDDNNDLRPRKTKHGPQPNGPKSKQTHADSLPNPESLVWFTDAQPELAIPVELAVDAKLDASGKLAADVNYNHVQFSEYELALLQVSEESGQTSTDSFHASMTDDFSASEVLKNASLDQIDLQSDSMQQENTAADDVQITLFPGLNLQKKPSPSPGSTTRENSVDPSVDLTEYPGDDPTDMKQQDSMTSTPEIDSNQVLENELVFRTGEGVSPNVSLGSDPTTGSAQLGLWQSHAAAQQHLLQQTTRAIKSHYQNDGTSQTISLELHPSELGQLTIHIERKKNRLTATIVTSEIVAEEMLNHEREELLQTLRDLGLGEAEVEIVYGGDREKRAQTMQPQSRDQDLASRQQATPNGETTNKQTTFLRGVNFVA